MGDCSRSKDNIRSKITLEYNDKYSEYLLLRSKIKSLNRRFKKLLRLSSYLSVNDKLNVIINYSRKEKSSFLFYLDDVSELYSIVNNQINIIDSDIKFSNIKL